MDMEEECRRLQENLRHLTETRGLLQEEFSQLGGMYERLAVQLKGDTVAGEGQLHAFHAQKRRAEARLEALEAEIALKDEALAQLDARASDYLLQVTTASNDFEEEPEEEDEGQVRTLVQRLVREDMAAHNELPPGEGRDEDEDEVPVLVPMDLLLPQEEEEEEVTPPTKAQMRSLSALVEELRRVKDEMGLCVSASKRSSLAELQATREELAFLRGSVSDTRGSYQASEAGPEDDPGPPGGGGSLSPSAGTISRRVALLEHEAGDAQERLAEARRQVALLTQERARKERECVALQKKVATVEGRAGELQKAFDNLVGAVIKERDDLAREKDTVAEEAETLRARLAALEDGPPPGASQDELEALEEKYRLQQEVSRGSLRELEASHEREMARAKTDFKTTEGELKARIASLEEDLRGRKDGLEELQKAAEEERRRGRESAEALEAERSKSCLLLKDLEAERNRVGTLTAAVKKMENEMADFAPSFREEMDRLREEAQTALREKTDLERTLGDLQQAEQRELTDLRRELEESREKVTSLEEAREADLLSKVTAKEEELSEELRAREATIQELRVTLTNNQKQWKENYQMLQDDLAAAQMRHAREKEETEAVLGHVKEKLLKAEEEAEKWRFKAEGLEGDLRAKENANPPAKETPMEPLLQEDDRLQKELALSVEKIGALEGTVAALESELTTKASRVEELEGELKEALKEDLKTKFEQQMAQIKELNDFVEDLRAKVDALTGEKESLTKALEEAKGVAHQLQEDLGAKKNLAEGVERCVRVFECCVIDSDVVVSDKCSLLDRVELLRVRVEEDLKALRAKMSEAKRANQALTKQANELEERHRILLEAKEAEARAFEEERNRTLEMQNAMVSDLEKLVLGLEKEKKDLEEELTKAQKERDILRQEIAALKVTLNEKSESESLALIQDLTRRSEGLETRLAEAQALLQEREASFDQRLQQERANHEQRVGRMRRDFREEMDILEQQKEELRQEMRWEVERVAAEWAGRLEEGVAEQEARLLEEKTQFGRVLVSKNDSYERLREEARIEAAGYQARLQDLQAQLDEKTHLAQDLEANLEEIVVVRDNLEEKLDLLKQSLLATSKSTPDGASPSLTQLLTADLHVTPADS